MSLTGLNMEEPLCDLPLFCHLCLWKHMYRQRSCKSKEGWNAESAQGELMQKAFG